MEITILMPCLNEEKTIGMCIDEARAYLEKAQINGEILIADNGSDDKSVEIAKDKGARVVHVSERGYGNTLRSGINNSQGDYIIMGDCDYSYNFSELDPFVEKLREGYDLVIGNRMNNRMETGAMPFWHRWVGVPFLSWIGRRMYHTDVKDFHCGLRAVNNESIAKLEFGSDGMEYASEMIGVMVKAGCKVAQIDITYRCDKRGHSSHLRSIPDGIRHIRKMLSIT